MIYKIYTHSMCFINFWCSWWLLIVIRNRKKLGSKLLLPKLVTYKSKFKYLQLVTSLPNKVTKRIPTILHFSLCWVVWFKLSTDLCFNQHCHNIYRWNEQWIAYSVLQQITTNIRVLITQECPLKMFLIWKLYL